MYGVPKGLYLLAKEPLSKSSPTPQYKNRHKNTRICISNLCSAKVPIYGICKVSATSPPETGNRAASADFCPRLSHIHSSFQNIKFSNIFCKYSTCLYFFYCLNSRFITDLFFKQSPRQILIILLINFLLYNRLQEFCYISIILCRRTYIGAFPYSTDFSNKFFEVLIHFHQRQQLIDIVNMS